MCQRRRVPTAELDLVVLGQRRRGVNLLSLIATLREEGRLPIRSVQWYLDTVHQLRRSVGAMVSAIHRTAQRAQPAVAAILDCIRASPVVHADETGPTKPAGVRAGPTATCGLSAPPPNATSCERYFLRRGRGQNSRGRGAERCLLRSIGQRLLRYHHYDGPKQRCWAHPCSSQGQALLRDIHDQRTLYPDAAPLARWADAVHGIYDRAKAGLSAFQAA